MVSNRTRANSSVGNKLVQLDSRVSQSETKPQSNLDANAVSSTQISTNAVTSDALAGAAVQDSSVARGAVGTENLGIINEINSDSSLTLNIGGATGFVKVVGDQYPVPVSGTQPLSLNSSNQVVLGLDATVADNTVAPLISSQTSATRTALNNIVARFATTKAILDTYTGAYIGQTGHVGSDRYAWDGSAWQLQLTQAQIHDGSVITTGTVAYARLDPAVSNGSNITSGTVAYGRLDTAVANASNLNNGTVPNGQLPSRLQETLPDISGGDWNNQKIAGWYRAYNAGNGPTGDWYYVQVYRHDDNYIRQIAYHYFSNNVYTRVENGGSWAGWTLLATNDQINSIYSAYDNGRIDYRSQNQVNSATSVRPPAYGAGISITPAGSSAPYSGTATVTFPGGRFTAQPVVVATPNSGSVLAANYCMTSNISTTSCTVTYARSNTTAASINVVAMQVG